MSKPIFELPDQPTESSVSSLVLSLRSDCEKKGVSAKNYAHRARVIRQQKELLSRSNHHQDIAFAADERRPKSMGAAATRADVGRERKPYTIFSSAADEIALQNASHQRARSSSAEESWDNEGGHMSSTAGSVQQSPGSPLPFVATLSHHRCEPTHHPFATMREAEAFIRRNTPVPSRSLATTYDRPPSDEPLSKHDMESTMNDETIMARLKVIDERLRQISSSQAASVLAGGLAQAGIHEQERLQLVAETERILDQLDGQTDD